MHFSSSDILPQPFGWIEIPAGEVKLWIDGNWQRMFHPDYRTDFATQVCQVSAFEIAKYPVTNAQFARFIAIAGYDQRQWWTDEGWDEIRQYRRREPAYWRHPKWNKPDYPVVGVSWYEAIAYCRWLSDLTGERICLPTEDEWQRAAQGDTDQMYAWGNEPATEERCNWGSETDRTNTVTLYEGKGDSPFGVVDMTGNVWEWCRTRYITRENRLGGTDLRVARGGSWMLFYSYALNICVKERMPTRPLERLDYLGFRCARY